MFSFDRKFMPLIVDDRQFSVYFAIDRHTKLHNISFDRQFMTIIAIDRQFSAPISIDRHMPFYMTDDM